MLSVSRRPREPVAHPDAPPGVCKYCGDPCTPGRRTHDRCREQQRASNDYTQAAREVEGEWQRCARCGAVAGARRHGQVVVIERDHPHELTDNGPRDWTVPLCTLCHRAKTNRARKAREGDTRMHRTLLGLAFLTVGVGVLFRGRIPGWLDEYAPGVPWPLVIAATVMAVLGLVVGAWLRWRQEKRRDTKRRLADLIAKITHTHPDNLRLKVTRWDGTIPVAGRCTYSAVFDDTDGSKGRKQVEALLRRKVGPATIVVVDPARYRLTWNPGDPTTSAAAPAVEVGLDRVTDGLQATFRAPVAVTVTRADDGKPTEFTVDYPPSARVHEDGLQDAVEDKVAALLPGSWRATWDTHHDRVTFTDRPDPLATPVPLPPLRGLDLAALPMGRRDDGHVWTVSLDQTHLLIGGSSGAGKGSVVQNLIRALSPGITDHTVEVWAVDPKGGMELGRARPLFARFAVDADDNARLLEDAVEFMQARAKRLTAAGSRRHIPSPGDPFLVVVIDEVAALTKYAGDRKQRDRINQALGLLTSQGRAVGVCVVGALQDPRKDVLTLRDLFTTRIALRLVEPTGADMVLGAGSRAAGARADRIPKGQPGTGYMVVDGSPDPVRFRAAWVSDDDIDALVAACDTTRNDIPGDVATADEAAWETVGVYALNGRIGDEAGDVIEVDLDGATHVVEVVDVEFTDDVEVVFEHPDGARDVLVVDADAKFRRRTPSHAH